MPENGSILLIESEGQIRQRVSRVLGKAGWSVTTTRSCAAGIEAAAAGDVGLVIVGIPRTGGVDGLCSIRAECPDVPVIVLVVPGDSRTTTEALNNGAFACLPRSFHPEELRAAAQRAAEMRRLADENRRLKKRVALLSMNSDGPLSGIPPDSSLRDVERLHIIRMLGHTGWNRTAAARLLSIDRKTLRNRIKEFGLERE